MAQDEFATFFNSYARQFHQSRAKQGIRRYQGVVGALGFCEILLALYILAEDFLPRWGDEDDLVVAKLADGLLAVISAMRYERISQESISSAKRSGSCHGSARPLIATWSWIIPRPASMEQAKPRARRASIRVVLPEPGPPVMM